jgi:hypothetical protein
MRFKPLRLLILKIGYYTPFTFYLLVFCILIFIGQIYLKKSSEFPESAYRDIFILLLKVVLVFGIALFIFGFVTVLISTVYLKLKEKQGKFSFSISTDVKDEKTGTQTVKIQICYILKPLMGFIKLRVNYDNEHFSDKFSLVSSSSAKFFDTSLEGQYEWELPEIREYKIQKVLLYFEDMFQFFSITLPVNTKNSFFTSAITREVSSVNALPRKTEDSTTRINELKRVEGEFFNYKNFESNDDVRRIVWKIYAKNKELVVRIPEIVDPYASHIYLYASFFSSLNFVGNEIVNIPLLNYYKTMCWSLYVELKKKGLEVRFRPDQDTTNNSFKNEDDRIRYSLSTAVWHISKPLKEFVKINDASIVIVSSLSDPNDVSEILERSGNDISFVFVPLSEAFETNNALSILKWIFIQEEKNNNEVFRSKWNLSAIKAKILQNEKVLYKLIRQYQKSLIAYIKE